MLYQTATVKNGQIVIESSKEVDQSTMTSDCIPVQVNGLSECSKCDLRNTSDCGGGKTLQKMLALPENKIFLTDFKKLKPKKRF